MRADLDNVIENNRLIWVDIIRIIGIIAVIAIHVEDSFIYLWNKIPWIDWWASNIYMGFIRFPIPLFIILSGYLLLNKQEDDRTFFKKRINKVVIPLVAWSMIYWIFANNYNIYSIFTIDFVQRLLANKIYYHLYFLYIILGLYLITPLLRRILEHSNMCDIHYYLVLWFIFSFINQLIGFFGYNIGIPLEAVTLNLGLYILGYAIKNTQITNRLKLLSGMLVVLSITITIIGTYFLVSESGQIDDSVSRLISITSVTYAVGLFILVREALSNLSLKGSMSICGNIIGTIGGATMGIYLVHPIILHYICHGISGIHFLSVDVISPIFSIPLVSFLLFVSSLLIVVIFQKIPIFRKIVP
ncbi:MAG: hypothetical protein QG646_163 [Euryarchaeota archaeon]|nr:hypothetical protein [Euryarchaeota archaeon]